MATAGLRIGVIGATGALGAELLEVIGASAIRVAQIVPIATEKSLGSEVEFQGEVIPVETELPSLHGLDFIFLCAPTAASLQVARAALRAEVPGIDLSGALAPTAEVPLQVADLGVREEEAAVPFIATPAGPALPWALVLHPLAERAGLVRVVGTVLDSASVGGVRGTESLLSESLALFNQQRTPDPTVFSQPVAFDCVPSVGRPDTDGDTPREQQAIADLHRLLGADISISITAVRVPTFLGLASSLIVETREPLDPDDAREVLSEAPGLEVWPEGIEGPTVRAAAGCDDVLVGRIRRDPTAENGLLFWIATDQVRLAATNAVKLAEARLAGISHGVA
jgi:aspartate-semialdehyde dehydrogenase